MSSKLTPGNYDCYERAAPDEELFVLLGRDPMAPSLVDLWASTREEMGENPAMVAEARACAARMRTWLAKLGKNEIPVL